MSEIVRFVARFVTAEDAVTGFRYFWAKNVKGFNPEVHCARCLVGRYEKKIGTKMPVNVPVVLEHDAGDLVYFCGVAYPYRWDRNMHLAVRVTGDPADTAKVDLWTGGTFEVAGARAFPFDAQAAQDRFDGLGRAFLTCRNFQFGAQVFAAEEV